MGVCYKLVSEKQIDRSENDKRQSTWPSKLRLLNLAPQEPSYYLGRLGEDMSKVKNGSKYRSRKEFGLIMW